MKFAIATAALLLLASAAKAQIKVEVHANGDVADIEDHVKAKIGSTARYTVVGHLEGPGLRVTISCLKAQSGGGEFVGRACSSVVLYFPFDAPLSFHLNGDANALVVCGLEGTAACGESIFNVFVEGTQQEKLNEAEEQLETAFRLHVIEVAKGIK